MKQRDRFILIVEAVIGNILEPQLLETRQNLQWLRGIKTETLIRGARGGAVVWGTAQFGFPKRSLGFIIEIILEFALVSTQPLTEISTRNVSWGVKAAGT